MTSPASTQGKKPFTKSWAVIIGIDKYSEGIDRLNNAVNDANAVGDVLKDVHEYEEQFKFTNEEAVKKRLAVLFDEELPSKVGENDRVFVYWAGHGVKTKGDGGPDGFLLPHDAILNDQSTYFSMTRLHDALINLKCRHLLVVLDTCFSGAFRWSGTRAVGGLDQEKTKITGGEYRRFVATAAWQAISSASQDQLAADEPSRVDRGGGEGGHSPFADFLLKALAKKSVADYTNDGVVTVQELYLYITSMLKEGQKPQLWPLKKHDTGEFIFTVGKHDFRPPPDLAADTNPWVGLTSYTESQAGIFFGRQTQTENLLKMVEANPRNPLTAVFARANVGKLPLVEDELVPKLKEKGWLAFRVKMEPEVSPLTALRMALRMALDPGRPMPVPDDDLDRSEIEILVKGLLEPDPKSGPNSEKPKVVLVVDQFQEVLDPEAGSTASPPPSAFGPQKVTFLRLLNKLLKENDRLHLVVAVRSDEPNTLQLPAFSEPEDGLTLLAECWENALDGLGQETRNEPGSISVGLRNPVTVVFGPSGVGKSSLIQAGLVPNLKKNNWHVVPVIRPGLSPLKALLEALKTMDTGPSDGNRLASFQLPSPTWPTPRRGRAATAAEGGRARATPEVTGSAAENELTMSDDIKKRIEGLIEATVEPFKVALLIDHFEELITLSKSAAPPFVKLLNELLEKHDRLHLVISVRSDFEQSLLDQPSFSKDTVLGKCWGKEVCRFEVEPMSRDELRQVIEMPAAKRVMYFKPSSLVETLVDEVVATPSALPLLSFALSEMYVAYWKRTQGNGDRAIEQADYDEVGGVVRALRKRADAVYQGMKEEPDKDALRNLLLRAVVREGSHLVARPIAGAELVFPTEAETTRCDKVVTSLTEAGLLVPGREGEGSVELAHVTLAREWEPVRRWVRDLEQPESAPGLHTRRGPRLLRASWASFNGRTGRGWTDGLAHRQSLTRAAGDWDQAEKRRKPGLVWKDRVRTGELASLVNPPAPWLNKRELEFAKWSIHSRRLADWFWYAAAAVFLFSGGAAIAFAVRATVLEAMATSRQLAAETSNALAEGDLDRAGLLAVEASGLPAPDAHTPLQTWRLATPKLRGYLKDTTGVYAVVLSPNGKTVASAQHARKTDSTTPITLWDVETRERSRTLRGHQGLVSSLAYDPAKPGDTATLAAATNWRYSSDSRDSSKIYFWDIPGDSGPRDFLPESADSITALAFGPDGTIASAGSGRILLWDKRLGLPSAPCAPLRTTPEPKGIHPGKEVEADVRARAPKTLPIWRVVDTLPMKDSLVQSLTFSPDGKTLAAVTKSGVTLWSLNRNIHIVKETESYWLIAKKFARPRNANLWPDLYQQSQAESSQPHWLCPGDKVFLGFEPTKRSLVRATDVHSVAFSPDGRRLAGARADGVVILWDPSSGQRVDSLADNSGAALSVAFWSGPSPKSKDSTAILAVGTGNGTVILWDVTKKGQPKQIGRSLRGHVDAVTTLGFGRGDSSLVSTSEDGKVVVWRIHGETLSSQRPSPGIDVGLISGLDHTVTRREVGSPPLGPADSTVSIVIGRGDSSRAPPRRPLGPKGAFRVVGDSADSMIASVEANGAAVLWKVNTGELIPVKTADDVVRDTLGDDVTSVAFGSGDGTAKVASAHTDGRVILWVVGDTVRHFATLQRRERGTATSVTFSPDGQALVSGYADGTIIRWDARLDPGRHRRHSSNRVPTHTVRSLAFSPDGQTLASAGGDGTVILWDIANMRQRGEPLNGLFRSLAFGPDTTTLAGVSDSGRVVFWDFSVASLKNPTCQAAGRNFFEPEWEESFEHDKYRPTCPDYAGKPSEGWIKTTIAGIKNRITVGKKGSVRWLAQKRTWLQFLGNLILWVWLPVLFPVGLWGLGKWHRRLARLTPSAPSST